MSPLCVLCSPSSAVVPVTANGRPANLPRQLESLERRLERLADWHAPCERSVSRGVCPLTHATRAAIEMGLLGIATVFRHGYPAGLTLSSQDFIDAHMCFIHFVSLRLSGDFLFVPLKS